MNLLESLPTVIGTAAVAPALLILWLVIAADERPGPPLKVWTAFLLGAASISLLGAGACAICQAARGAGEAMGCRGPAFGVRRRLAGGNRQDPRHRRGRHAGAPAHLRRSDGHRGLWRGRRARLCGLRKPRLSGAACGDVAIARGVAQRADGAVPRRARRHRRRLSRDRAIRHRARREPASPRLGAHLKLDLDADGPGGAACGVRFSAADAAAKPGPRSIDPAVARAPPAC